MPRVPTRAPTSPTTNVVQTPGEKRGASPLNGMKGVAEGWLPSKPPPVPPPVRLAPFGYRKGKKWDKVFVVTGRRVSTYSDRTRVIREGTGI